MHEAGAAAHREQARPAPRLSLKVLDGLRGGAAAYVMIGHAIWLLAQPAGPAVARPWWGWVQVGLAFLFRYGHEAVMLFFVLSGIVIHLRLAQSRAAGNLKFDVKTYAWRRFTRIYPPLVGALLFTIAMDAVGRAVNPAFYSGAAPQADLNGILAQGNHSFITLVGNLTFAQTLLVPAFGTDQPLWSLSYEGFFYILYPLLFVPLYRRYGPRPAFAAGWALSAAGWALWLVTGSNPWSWPAYFGLWLLGAAIAETIARRWPWPRWFGAAFAAALAGMAGMMLLYGKLPLSQSDVMWGVVFAVIMLGLVTQPHPTRVVWLRRALEMLHPLADQSYTLYLFHVPAFITASTLYLRFYPALPKHFGFTVLGIAAALVFTALIAQRLERIGRRTLKL